MNDRLEKKCKARSIRITERVEKYVLAHPGEGFNQKFESLVLNYKEAEPALNKRIKEKQSNCLIFWRRSTPHKTRWTC